MAEPLFDFTYNDQPMDPSLEVMRPGVFGGEIKPNEEWPAGTNAVAATLAVFTTPIESYIDLEDELSQRNGQVVSLGDVRTWTQYGGSVELQTEDGNLYDVFCVATRPDGTGAMHGGSRFAVTDDPEYAMPHGLTFDEAKFFGYTALGLTGVEAQGVNVKVTPMTAWGDTLPGRFIIAGLEIMDTPTETFGPGIMVTHLGGVDFYHGANAAQTLEAAGLDK